MVYLIRSGTRQRCVLSMPLINNVPELLTNAIIQQKEIKGIYMVKGEIKLYLFKDGRNVYIENLKKTDKKSPVTNKQLYQDCKVQG